MPGSGSDDGANRAVIAKEAAANEELIPVTSVEFAYEAAGEAIPTDPSKERRQSKAPASPKKEFFPKDDDATSGSTFRHPIDFPWSPRAMWQMITYSWVSGMVSTGRTKELESDDLVPIPKREHAKGLADELEEAWGKEKAKPNSSLFRAYVSVFGWIVLKFTLLIIIESAMQLGQPILLGRIIRGLQDEDSSEELYTSAGYLVALSLVYTLQHHYVFLNLWRQGMHFRTGSIGLIFRKALHVSKQAMVEETTGKIVNLASSDVERMAFSGIFLPYLIVAPLQTAFAIWIIWGQLGPCALAGLAALVVTIPYHFFASRMFTKLRSTTAKLTDSRVKSMNEIIVGMRVVKMYAWEDAFKKLIGNIREDEVKAIHHRNQLKAVNLSFYVAAAVLSSFASFLCYELSGNNLTAEKVFTTISVFGAIRLQITLFFPGAIEACSELRVVFGRIQKFLELDDLRSEDSLINLGKKDSTLAPGEDASLDVKELSASWVPGVQILKDINLSLRPGELCAVAGRVGSGKTSLLMTLLNELSAEAGSVTVKGRIGYASQQAWILSSSVKDNIVFGEEWDAEWYRKVIIGCQLESDISTFEDGHETLVGERGVTLSGGQRARISLARAVYAKCDVYLLDDPLSAVDVKVGYRLFHDCIRGLLKNSICVLVTHQIQFLPNADKILLLGADGHCEGVGTYDELLAEGHDLSSVVEDHGEDETDKSDDKKTFTPAIIGKDRKEKKNFKDEHRKQGSITGKTYLSWAKAAGGWPFSATFLILCLVVQANQMMLDWWLAYWVDLKDEDREDDQNLAIYGGLTLFFVIIVFIRGFFFMYGASKASENLHNKAFAATLATDVRFFDTNPVGRVLNRFGADMGFLDDYIPTTVLDFIQLFFVVVGTVLLVSSLNPWVFLVALPLTVVFAWLRSYYIQSARAVKRLEATERSPIYSLFSASLLGLETIRSRNAEMRFQHNFEGLQDNHGKAYFTFIVVSRWLGFRLDMLTFLFIAGTAFAGVAARDSVDPGDLGLQLTYALQLTALFQWCVRQSTEVENQMTSTERIVEYIDLPKEEKFVHSLQPDAISVVSVDKSWPSKGGIEFDDLRLRYDTDDADVLKGITCKIHPREKIGIVGRTGAGKSSLISALFQLSPTTGSLKIDGVEARSVPLGDLRKRIGVIPQDPVMFTGTVRRNLDPFLEFSDEEVWNVLEEVELKQDVKTLEGGLNHQLSEAGGNFSVGQRQLMCLARAILRQSKILVLDEATASVDTHTDALIQESIRKKFADCTVLTIAHRINTILDADRVMVVEAGRVQEFDTPANLAAASGSFFGQLVDQAGIAKDTIAGYELSQSQDAFGGVVVSEV